MNKPNFTPGAKLMSILLISISINAVAGNGAAMAGQYSIGKSNGANFTSVAAAATALKNEGVSAPVTFTIESGTYNEQVIIAAIKGASQFNTVTFTSASGNNADAVISNGTDNATVIVNGSSYVSFKNITIDHQSAASGNAIRVEGQASHISFKGVAFYGVNCTKTGNDYATIYFTAEAAKTNVTFKDCEISNGSTGISKSSTGNLAAGTSINNTLFFNQYEGALALANEETPFIGNNVIRSSSTFNSFKAISLDNIANGLIVRNNAITATTGSMGLVMNNCTAQAANMGQVIENSININGKTEACGIYLSGSTSNQLLSFNKVNLLADGSQAAAYYKNTSAGSNISMVSNFGYGLNSTNTAAVPLAGKSLISQSDAQNSSAL